MNARAPTVHRRSWTLGELRLARKIALDYTLTWREIADRLGESYAPARTADSIEFKLQKDFPRQSKRRWTKAELQYLKAADRQRTPLSEILQRLDRTPDACLYQARRLKLSQAFVWKTQHYYACASLRKQEVVAFVTP